MFNVASFFSGAGGFDLGFEKMGFNIVLANDNWKPAIETFKSNFPKTIFIEEDIRNISENNLKLILKENGIKKIDVIIGGPPCQGFSMAGRRIPNDPRNSLFREYLRIIKKINPKIFVMENVRGLLSMKTPDKKKVVDVIINEFSKIGYLTKCYKVNTADYGVPQKRHRIFIIGTRNLKTFNFPKPTHSKEGVNGFKKWAGIKEIILPKTNIPKNYFYSERLIKGFQKREKINREKNVGYGWQFINIKEPSYTISARYWKDGAEALIRYNNKCIRMLTPEECARIQSFPKSHTFSGNKREIYTQIGNAVPPVMAGIIAKAIKAHLE